MKPILILLLGFVFRVAIIASNPIVWGGDTVIRLFDRHTLVKAHQLPMLQVLIAGVSTISMNPVLVQYMMAVIGAVAGLGFYKVVADLCGEKWAFPAAILFVTHPYILAVSTVPYQEILMLAGLTFAFHFFYTERWLAASLCLAIACVTRYEAWAACPVLALTYVLRKDRSFTGVCKGAVLFGWMPVAWLVVYHGLTQSGHFVIERHISIWRLQRYVYLGWITVKFTQIPVLLLAAVGAWRLYVSGLDWRWWVHVAFVGLFGAAILFSAHGVSPDTERYVTSREAHILMYFVLLLAGAGLAQWPRWDRAIVMLSAVLGVGGAVWYVHDQISQPEVKVAYEVAQFLDHSLQIGDRALILAKPISEGDSRMYLDKARETGGEEGFQKARQELQEISATPPDYQRVVVYSRLGRERILAPPVTCAEWVAVWDDDPDPVPKVGDPPVQVFRSGAIEVNIFRGQCVR